MMTEGGNALRITLTIEELNEAVKDYLVKQGLSKDKLSSILFNKKDGSLNYEVYGAEISYREDRTNA